MRVLTLKRALVGVVLLGVVALGGVAYLGTQLTAAVPVEFRQETNAVEAREANRKLRLLEEALQAKRPGFVRLSEVEINSHLKEKFQGTNAPAGEGKLHLVRTGVLLGFSRVTFVNWLARPLFGQEVPVVWQRVFKLGEGGDPFVLESMQVGEMAIPKRFWPQAEQWLGGNDTVFTERREWLAGLPKVTLARSEAGKEPELRLFSRVPGTNEQSAPVSKTP